MQSVLLSWSLESLTLIHTQSEWWYSLGISYSFCGGKELTLHLSLTMPVAYIH